MSNYYIYYMFYYTYKMVPLVRNEQQSMSEHKVRFSYSGGADPLPFTFPYSDVKGKGFGARLRFSGL